MGIPKHAATVADPGLICYPILMLMRALLLCCAAGWADPKRAAVVGGSHGGFLTGHLVGQHPAAFRCGGLRNPVLNIALMVGLTDIPDWCYVEAFGTEVG